MILIKIIKQNMQTIILDIKFYHLYYETIKKI